MDRRGFLGWTAALGMGGFAIRLLGNPAYDYLDAGGDADVLVSENDDGTTTVQVYDLVMEGWSTLGSGFLGDNGILTAKQIVAFKPLVLNYVQDPHGHKFSLGEKEFAQILKGKPVSVFTTVMLDHHHEVRVKPTRRVPGARPLTVTIDSEGRPVPIEDAVP